MGTGNSLFAGHSSYIIVMTLFRVHCVCILFGRTCPICHKREQVIDESPLRGNNMYTSKHTFSLSSSVTKEQIQRRKQAEFLRTARTSVNVHKSLLGSKGKQKSRIPKRPAPERILKAEGLEAYRYTNSSAAGQWTCTRCTLVNAARQAMCAACEAPRKAKVPTSGETDAWRSRQSFAACSSDRSPVRISSLDTMKPLTTEWRQRVPAKEKGHLQKKQSKKRKTADGKRTKGKVKRRRLRRLASVS